MHWNENWTNSLVVKCTVRSICKFEVAVGARPDVLVQRMKDRLHGLCNSPFIQHITLLALSNLKILDMEVEAAMELSRQLDETGLHIIYTN